MSTSPQKYFLSIVCLLISFACMNSENPSNALPSNPAVSSKPVINKINACKKELSYNFNVANKLDGKGAVELQVLENTIKGNAKGFGRIKKYDVDLITSLNGTIDNNGGIIVHLDGIAAPTGPIPGKVTFNGPLHGIYNNGVLKFIGTVNVDGFLAKTVGFKSTENIVIEIEDSKLAESLYSLQRVNPPS